MPKPLGLTILSQPLAVCRLNAREPVPAWAESPVFTTTTRTRKELSITCPWDQVPEGVQREGPFRAFEVAGPLDFSLTGILASLAEPLARAEVSIFAISTFDTDYVLVPAALLEEARETLGEAGFEILEEA